MVDLKIASTATLSGLNGNWKLYHRVGNNAKIGILTLHFSEMNNKLLNTIFLNNTRTRHSVFKRSDSIMLFR